jgi:magnesium-transporting ATPase (P-type)
MFSRYQPPELDRDKSNTDNSQNTALFLVSCYQYILSGVVLSIGPPFRQSMTANGTLAISPFPSPHRQKLTKSLAL